MKAVIVIDVPDGVSLDEWYAVNVVIARFKAPEEELIHCIPFDESKTFKFVPLRPLPSEMKEREGEDSGCLSFRNGWNSCLFEIEGDPK